MPVVAAIESGRQLSGWGHIRIAVQRMANVIWVFFVNARERKIREPVRSVDVKTRSHGGRLSNRTGRGKKEKPSPKCGPHRAATLNEVSAGLKPLGQRPRLKVFPEDRQVQEQQQRRGAQNASHGMQHAPACK